MITKEIKKAIKESTYIGFYYNGCTKETTLVIVKKNGISYQTISEMNVPVKFQVCNYDENIKNWAKAYATEYNYCDANSVKLLSNILKVGDELKINWTFSNSSPFLDKLYMTSDRCDVEIIRKGKRLGGFIFKETTYKTTDYINRICSI